LLQVLVQGGYHAFAEAELAQREAAGFPPFAHLALLRAEGAQVEPVRAFLDAARRLFDDARGEAERVDLHGPMPAPMPRRAGHHRAQLLLGASQRPALQGLLSRTVPALHALPEARRVRWSLDVDPTDLY
jgi:primosomal protein N' (replication factor Y)